MPPRQTGLPCQWFIVDPHSPSGRDLVRWLPPGAGILVVGGEASAAVRRLARIHRIPIAEEARGNAARVHNARELRRALSRRTPLILLSPIHRTGSHPDWQPLPRMRAATLARLGGRRLLALGGMNAKRFRRIERLGFQGWAGISAFRT